MEWHQLDEWQAKHLQQQLADHLSYLRRLEAWMDERGFPYSDPLYRAVSAAIKNLGDAERLATIRAGQARRRSGKSCPLPPRA